MEHFIIGSITRIGSSIIFGVYRSRVKSFTELGINNINNKIIRIITYDFTVSMK